jgi:hypothetical protein
MNEDGQIPKIKSVFQPASLPDLNLNDVGTDDQEALWGAVRASWSALRAQMLEKLWGTL